MSRDAGAAAERQGTVEVSDRLIDFQIPEGATPAMAKSLRKHVPGIVAEAVAEIQREVPQYARPHDARYSEVLAQAVEWSISHFVELMADPDTSSTEIVAFFREVGVGEAREGRSLESLQSALRTGAGVAVRRLTEASERTRHRVTAGIIAEVAQSVLTYINRLADVVAEGHNEVSARAVGERQNRRRKLLDLLIGAPAPRLANLREPAREADWRLPRTVAALALKERRPDVRPPTFPDEVLPGLHLDEPCLLVPDPAGPGRGQMLRAGLRDWVGVLGPTVEITELAKSLRWARQALTLAASGIIEHDGFVRADDHIPILVMTQDRDLLERAAAQRLEPLMKLRPTQRHRLAETFLASLECGFNATQVSLRLQVHAQTIRYRVRQLETFFGDDIYDPGRRLEFHMLLHAWLATRPAAPDQPKGPVNGRKPVPS
ncbi:helix-turn-helix domain-containing protein [Actinomadura sp. 9N407]|uniref:PucR family transcriptional regulator n=1 Tax=Actinomadura sp. 9N407 TaxID=3375154 RepID=UPI00378E9591